MLKDLSIEEKYLAGQVSDEEIIQHFQHSRQSVKKSEGAVYTPPWIVAAMLDRADIRSLRQEIIEPSAGHGSFVLPLIRHVQAKFRIQWDDAARWFKRNVTCLDLDPDAVQELRTIVTLFFARKGVRWLRDYDLDNIRVGDGLAEDAARYDIAIGNPPYIRTQGLDPDYRTWLRSNFEIARHGNIDIYYAFLDHYMTRVPRCVFIVPNGCIKASGARALRERVFPLIDEVVDFRADLVFPNARTYTCILSSRIGHAGTLDLRLGLDAPARPVEWRSITGAEIHTAPRVAKSGLATLADPVFTARRNAQTGNFEATFEKKSYEIETGILRPFYKVTKLAAMADLDSPDRFIIFPYRSLNGKDVIPEDDLARLYPKAYAYLCAVKPRLLARDRGKTDKYAAWYAYGRTQGLHDLENLDLVFVPTMIGGTSKPKAFDTTRVTAQYGAPLFVSGFAVTASKEARQLLLSEAFLDYVRENGTPKPGASELYYAISSKHVNAFLAAAMV